MSEGTGALFDTRRHAALDLLAACLNDPDPWDADDLVSQMEAVFIALGGTIVEGEARA